MEQILKTFDLNALDGQMIIIWGAIFIVLWQILSAVVFKRFIALTELRDASTSGAKEDAQRKLDEAAAINTQVEDRLAEVRVTAMREKLDALSTARAQAQRIVDDTENQIQQKIDSSRRELGNKIQSLRKELESDTEEMARSVVANLKKPTTIEAR